MQPRRHSLHWLECRLAPAVVGAFRSDGEGEFGKGSHYPHSVVRSSIPSS